MSATLRARRRALFVATSASVVALVGVFATVFLLRNPDVWSTRDSAPPIYRVQSRSMEPAYNGPRFLWTCPNCRDTFPTSFDVGTISARSEVVETDAVGGATRVGVRADGESGATSSAPALSPEATRALARLRYLTCPKCGCDRVPARDPTFQNGSSFRARAEESTLKRLGFFARVKRAWNRERAPKSKRIVPERWDAVVFNDPYGRATLKRVVGLPGELISFCNGDAFINGKIPYRTLEQIERTAVSVGPIEFRRADDRVDAVCVSPIWEPDPDGIAPDGSLGTTTLRPRAVSNESTVPCCNGSNVAPVELVRDFIFSFRWTDVAGLNARFAVLVRRPEKAILAQYDESINRVVVREKRLIDGSTFSGRPFSTLTTSDFFDEEGVQYDAPSLSSQDARFTVATIDGALIFAIDGEECFRHSLGDVDSGASVPIDTPFSLLGTVVRARDLSVYRDLHYSNAPPRAAVADKKRFETLAGSSFKAPEGGYFVLGDNSPASIDSRFDALGCVDESDLAFIVE